MDETLGEIVVARRFRGPPDSGNGGYVCGRLAAFVDGDAVVRLERPPPLERPLAVRRSEEGVLLCDGAETVARARRAPLALEVPEPPSWHEAVAAQQRFRGFSEHYFPGCFVCGPERGAEDGLRIFPGESEDARCVAASWTPDASLAAPGSGTVLPEFVWAALDCPGAFSFPQPQDRRMLLGELAGQVADSVEVGEQCVVIGWTVAHEGRKHRTGSALFDARSRCVARALGTWIEIPLA